MFMMTCSGFDSECAERIGDYMSQHNVKFIRPATPNKIEKLEDGKLRVTYNNDQSEDFDTVSHES